MAVKLELPEQVDWAEALRYVGVFEKADEALQARLQACQNQLFAAARPVGWWVRLGLSEAPAGLFLSASDIQRHLAGCREMVLLGVSLGAGTDTLLRRLSATAVAEASLTDALASALTDEMAGQLEQIIRLSLQKEGRYATGRYSPGYGNWPIDAQRMLCQLLDAQRRLGVCCSGSFLLSPRKSVTALMGVSDKPVKGQLAGCGHCVLRQTCMYRRRGKTCADF